MNPRDHARLAEINILFDEVFETTGDASNPVDQFIGWNWRLLLDGTNLLSSGSDPVPSSLPRKRRITTPLSVSPNTSKNCSVR